MPLTDTGIRNLKPEAKAKKYADGEGLFLFVTANGIKSWRFRYRDILCKEKEMTLGLYPIVSLQDARGKRFEVRKLLSEGKDPIADKKEQTLIAQYNASNSFKIVAEEWITLNKEAWTRKYALKVENRFIKYIYPVVGNKPINEISGLEILSIIRKIEHDCHYETAHKLLQNCITVFRLAFLTKRVLYNPLTDLRGVLKSYKSKSLPAIDISELNELFNKLHEFKTAELDKIAIKLLAYTFVRTNELRKAKKEEFDFKKKIWTIPSERMKMRREHLVPLSRQSIKLLKQAFGMTSDNEYVFPTKLFMKYPYMNENVINDILSNLGYGGRHSGHGFRSLASTTLNELGWYHPQIIEKQLAHEEKNKVKAAYNRAQYLPKRTQLMQRWADHIDQIVIRANNKKLKNAA